MTCEPVVQAGGPAQARPSNLPPFTKKLLRWSFAVGIVPPIVLVVALATNSLYLLEYVHVISGGTWTGFDLYMGLVMTVILRSLEIPGRIEIAKRLTPTTFFIIPSLAATAITSGIYLAQALGKFDLSNPWIMGAGVVVLILIAQGFGVFLPNGIRIFLELAKARPNTELISRLTMRNLRLAASQAVFQFIIILIMAHLAIY
jgi:hypothetical protein